MYTLDMNKIEIVNAAVVRSGATKRTASIVIRIEPELRDLIAAAALREHRSAAGYVRKLLIERLGQEKVE